MIDEEISEARKERKRIRERAYRIKHRERINEQARARYERNPHKNDAACRAYRQTHLEKRKIKDREYYGLHKEDRKFYERERRKSHPEIARQYRKAHEIKMAVDNGLYRLAHRDEISMQRKDWRMKNPEKIKVKTELARYRQTGFTPQAFEEQLEEQGYQCPLCNIILQDGLKRDSACADHNHATGQTRAVLCRKCNAGLGGFNDDPILLRKAAAYLESYMPLEFDSRTQLSGQRNEGDGNHARLCV